MLVEDRARSILTENVVDDVDYRWTANPYRGCAFACAACYARGSHEYLDLDPGLGFDRTIAVRRDAPELLREAFAQRSWEGQTVTFSSVTDPYQAIERELEITRKCLEVCVAYRNPVRIATVSPLAARDADLFRALGARVDVRISMLEPLEPDAPTTDERIALIAALARAGVEVGAMCAPIISGLNDAHVPAMLERAAAAGATSACWTLLRLPEPTATVFEARLRAAMPNVADKLLSRAGQTRAPGEHKRFHVRGEGGGAYVAAIEAMFATTTARLGLARRRFAKTDEPKRQLALFR